MKKFYNFYKVSKKLRLLMVLEIYSDSLFLYAELYDAAEQYDLPYEPVPSDTDKLRHRKDG